MIIKDHLNDEIVDELKQLKGIDVGTEEFKVTVEELIKLVDRAITIEKLEIERAERLEIRTAERELKQLQLDADLHHRNVEQSLKERQMESERRDQLIRNCIAAAGIIIPSFITIWGTYKSFEFEKEGTITTIMGRGFINKLLPKK